MAAASKLEELVLTCQSQISEIAAKVDQIEKRISSIPAKPTAVRAPFDDSIMEGRVVEWSRLTSDERSEITYLMNNFNFNNVKKVMDVLDWWWMGEHCPPSLDTIKKEAFRLLVDACTEHTTIGTGGFEAVYRTDDEEEIGFRLGLRFIAEDLF